MKAETTETFTLCPAKPPIKIEETINKIAINTLRNIKGYGEEYLQNNGLPHTLSDGIFAAGLARHTMRDTKNKQNEYISIIGLDAYSIMETAKNIQNHPTYFHSPSVSPEAKLLHLITVKIDSDKILRNSEELDKYQPQDQSNHINGIQKFINHIDQLNLIPEKSGLERITTLRTNEAKQNLDAFSSSPPSFEII